MATNHKISLLETLTLEQRKRMLEYAKTCATKDTSFLGNFRQLLLYRDISYQRQLNTTAEHIKAVRSNMAGNGRAIQDMTVPIAMPQVESATAYQAGVFLTQYPIFGVIASKEQMSQAKMFEVALADQSLKHGWARELIKVLRMGNKYNFGPAVVKWQKSAVKKIATYAGTDADLTGKAALQNDTYGGNCITAWDPYNMFMDTLVPPADLHHSGEFAGCNKLVNRVQLMTLLRGLDSTKTTNLREAYESQMGTVSTDSTNAQAYYRPRINPYLQLQNGGIAGATNWAQYMDLKQGKNIQYKDAYVLTPFYCRARPADFGAVGNHLVTYYVLIVNWSQVVYVEELNTAQEGLPCFVAQPLEDGLGYQTQSLLDNAMPFQDMSSALWNINLQAKRRLVFDRLVYNPRLIDKKDIDIASSVSRIPLRNAAIADGDNPIAKAVYQIPYRDVDSSGLQMSQLIEQMADTATGQNKVDRGQFQKGNKTAAEFQTVMGNSNSRQQLTAISLEHQFFTPIKEAVKANTLQFQPPGKIFSRQDKQIVDFDPVQLREAMIEFKITDGLLPADKMLSAELLQVFMQTAQAMPAMATEFDVLGMFLYWLQAQGATWVDDFRRDPAAQQKFLQTVQQTTDAQTPTEPILPPGAAA